MESFDLQLHRADTGPVVTAFLQGPTGNRSFALSIPDQLVRSRDLWIDKLILHLEQGRPTADAVRHYAERLCVLLGEWLEDGSWLPLQQALQSHPGLPLRISCFDGTGQLALLPWEQLPLARPIWRLGQASCALKSNRSSGRLTRVLLLVGNERGLDLSPELERFSTLKRQGRIDLTVLRGAECHPSAIRSALAQAKGWDLLAFLGHSDADPSTGGRLLLGDGGSIAGASLTPELKTAASNGLGLAVLASCSGLDLAQTFCGAGIPWTLCFREKVPTQAAAITVLSLLEKLEAGVPFSQAIGAVRELLGREGPATSELLLSAVSCTDATGFTLPLRKRQQIKLRLASSQKPQLVAAAIAVVLGATNDLVPWNPVNLGLLDRRLNVQRVWRQLTHQEGPSTAALPLLMLDAKAYQDFGVDPNQEGDQVSRQVLARVLQAAPPERVPSVALDFVLDSKGSDPAAYQEFLTTIQKQRRPSLFAGYFGPTTCAPNSGSSSHPLTELTAEGLQSFDLSVETSSNSNSNCPEEKLVPLQLHHGLWGKHFAVAVSGNADGQIPSEAVIDWSINWQSMITPMRDRQSLEKLKAPILLVGSNGYGVNTTNSRKDVFVAPWAAKRALSSLEQADSTIPGVLVQAVLAQSVAMHHWLTPLLQSATAALAAGLGVVLAAVETRRSRQLLWLGVIAIATTVVALQIAVTPLVGGTLFLIPLVLPLATLTAVVLSRR